MLKWPKNNLCQKFSKHLSNYMHQNKMIEVKYLTLYCNVYPNIFGFLNSYH